MDEQIKQIAMRLQGLRDALDLTVEQVAEAAGYCNAYYCGRVFKARTGTPPGAYRTENGR